MMRILHAAAGLSLAGVLVGCSMVPTEDSAFPEPPAPNDAPSSATSRQPHNSTPASPGTAEPNNAPSTQARELPHSGAPAVTNPLPISVLPKDPCRAFTRKQLVYFLGADAPRGKREDIATGPWCSWQDHDTGAGVFVNFITTTGQGLSNLYRKTKPYVKVWREIRSIGGFPAVAFQMTEKDTSCSVNVGLADEYTVSAAAAPSRAKKGKVDACKLAEHVAGFLVGNLKKKAGR